MDKISASWDIKMTADDLYNIIQTAVMVLGFLSLVIIFIYIGHKETRD